MLQFVCVRCVCALKGYRIQVQTEGTLVWKSSLEFCWPEQVFTDVRLEFFFIRRWLPSLITNNVLFNYRRRAETWLTVGYLCVLWWSRTGRIHGHCGGSHSWTGQWPGYRLNWWALWPLNPTHSILLIETTGKDAKNTEAWLIMQACHANGVQQHLTHNY